MESFGIASVAGITVICYLMGLIVKNLPLNNKWIPSLAGLLGGILGLVGWRFMPDFPAFWMLLMKLLKEMPKWELPEKV